MSIHERKQRLREEMERRRSQHHHHHRDHGRSHRSRNRPQLDLDSIVHAAIDIADRDGPDAMTMRAVAKQLDVGVMSLYWYVPTKRDLEGLILQRLMDDAAPPAEPTGDWRQDLASIAWNARRNLLEHQWIVDMFSRVDFADESAFGHGILRHLEYTMRMVEQLPLDFATKTAVRGLIDSFAMGFTFDEIVDVRRLKALGLTEQEFQQKMAPRIRELLSEEEYPLFTNYMQHDHELPDKDTEFETALQILLDGVEVQIRAASNKADTSSG